MENSKSLKQKNLRLEQAVDKAVAQTKRQADEIARLYEVKNQFFSNISHELRTPLTLILGPSSDLLEDGSLKTSQKKTRSPLSTNNAKRLLRLINQLLDLSKFGSRKIGSEGRSAGYCSICFNHNRVFQFLGKDPWNTS